MRSAHRATNEFKGCTKNDRSSLRTSNEQNARDFAVKFNWRYKVIWGNSRADTLVYLLRLARASLLNAIKLLSCL
jgi:hypothetical protein